jgi:CheY-like chemotaxis protein
MKLQTLNPKMIDKFAGLSLENSKKLLHSFDEYLVLMKDQPDHSQNIFLNKEEIKIVPFFQDIIQAFLPQAHLGELKLYFKTNIDYDSKKRLPALALKCICNNLLSNALKFTPSSKSIFISFMLKKNTLELSVEDEGYGISREDQKKIFDRFYQARSEEVSRGFGIGLSLVKHIVDILKGSIVLESEPDNGSTFKVELPLEDNKGFVLLPASKIKPKKLVFNVEDDESEKLSLPNILVVDDDFEMQRYLINLFENKYNCYTANDGSQGMEILENNDIKLIISDLRMPKVDGYSFKEKLNASDKYKDIPFILMSATAIADKNVKLKLGIDEYINKPFSSQELLKRVYNILEKEIYKEKALNEQGNETVFHGTHSQLIENLHKHIKENLSDPEFSVDDIAKKTKFSRRQLNALLKRQMGLTLTSLVMEVRLLQAYDFIVNKKYHTLNEVMYTVGINSRSYFNKKFEARFGIKPGVLMKNFN